MINYVVRRIGQAIPQLLIISLLLFGLMQAFGDPIGTLGGRTPPRPEDRLRLRRQWGLDQPLYMQYLVWLVGNDWMQVDTNGDGGFDGYGTRKGILRGDFGFSFRTRQPVLTEISLRLPNTIYLMVITLILALSLAIPIGILSALRQYSAFDIIATTFSFAGQALPEFWLGLILLLVFYAWLKNPLTGDSLMPSGGISSEAAFVFSDRISHLILPVATGALGWIAWYSRFLRSSMLEILPLDYLRTARAKGLPERLVLYRHALRNALIPLVTLLAIDAPYIFMGAVFTETIFSWPGMGRLYYQAAVDRDYPLLLAVLIISAAFIILSNLLADMLYAYLDPRVRYQ